MEEEPPSPVKKLRSPLLDKSFNNKTSITCTQVPESLFESKAAEKHFSKFGRVHRIRLMPKKHICIVEYDQQISAERAVLNAGAFDGFMFDVTRTKPRIRRKSKKDDDPDWLPDSDVRAELSAMIGGPTYRLPRQKSMDVVVPKKQEIPKRQEVPKRQQFEPKQLIKKRTVLAVPKRVKPPVIAQPINTIEPPIMVTTIPTSLTTAEAAAELHKLRSKVSLSPDEKWRILDARDRLLRAWGGAGSRVKVGGATIGTCPDMCPEKELLHRQAEHQVMTLETIIDSDGLLEPWRAVKQYSRSSADQEIPMCYELRPPSVLMRTCVYLLHEIADTTRQVTLAEWFHFMWDRFRGIRKDITQQALCCAESIILVEICARFHAHCAARLADLEHTQFDQKLNTDNLTKCLQTLKHMYGDVAPEQKPNEAEFRGYIALLNLGDANFWWEIKQLPLEIQKSESIMFAIQIYITLDNNNYVKFFRLIQEKATYLQACILLRYFNDVRARALARIVKAYAPRGGSMFPAEELMNTLAFESIESMKLFVDHYGLRFAKNDTEFAVILSRTNFIEDSDPFPLSRAINLIESKMQQTVGEVISGGNLPAYNYTGRELYSSFNNDGRIKESALTAEDLGYNTINDSNKDVQMLKAELQKLLQVRKSFEIKEKVPEPERNVVRQELPTKRIFNINIKNTIEKDSKFSFQPAIPVAPADVIHNSPEKVLQESSRNVFTFSKPQATEIFGFAKPSDGNLFGKLKTNVKDSELHLDTKTVFTNTLQSGNLPNTVKGVLKDNEPSNVFKSAAVVNSIFGQQIEKSQDGTGNIQKNIFAGARTNLFSQNDNINKNVFANVTNNLFSNTQSNVEKTDNIFAKPQGTKSIFGGHEQHQTQLEPQNIFKIENNNTNIPQTNGETINTSPSSLFKSANKPTFELKYSIFQTKNKAPTVADNIMNSVHTKNDVYEFNQNENQYINTLPSDIQGETQEEDKRRQEEMMKLENEKMELKKKQEEEKRKEEALRLKELRDLEEKRKKQEQKRQEELLKKLEEEKLIELKKQEEEADRLFRSRVETESSELIDELVSEVNDETITVVLNEEIERFKMLTYHAEENTANILTEVINEICQSEIKAELFRIRRVSNKWYNVWRKHFIRNYKRRTLLEDTPVWLTNHIPQVEATFLRRATEAAALRNMKDIHRGYKFTGELKSIPPPQPYNIVDLIRSPLLKRMKQIAYPCDKCFFWKVSLITQGATKWLYKKINLERWLKDVFSDNKPHDVSETLIYVDKKSWNNLIDFAVSVSLIKSEDSTVCNEALNGANGAIFYATENDSNHIEVIEQTMKHKYQYHIFPIALIMTEYQDTFQQNNLDKKLTFLKQNNVISDYKIYTVEAANIENSINACTKSALKWLAKHSPRPPSLEIDHLKSICQRYLGNEIWYKLKSEKDQRTEHVLKNLEKLVECYNLAVDKLTKVITNENLFNYPSFPLEFTQYLDNMSPYPKPYEFIPSNVKQTDNTSAILNIMQKLRLPNPNCAFLPKSICNMQDHIRDYCNQIGLLTNPEQVVCKVVAILPNELSDTTMPSDEFNQHFHNYDPIDFLNVIVYERINSLDNFDNRFAIYEKSDLEAYRNIHWLYDLDVYAKAKHRIIEYDNELDFYIEAKRRKIESASIEVLMLEDNDRTLIEENIKVADENIAVINSCKNSLSQLEQQIIEEKKKSDELENLLRRALSNV